MDIARPVHASAFAYDGAGCLLLGDSASGKSRLLAEAIIAGAQMIADDQVQLRAVDGRLLASAPPPLAGVLELRGIGLVQLPDILDSHAIHLAVSLVAGDSAVRLPEPQTWEFAGVSLPHLVLAPVPVAHPASLLLYLKAMQVGRIMPTDWRPQV